MNLPTCLVVETHFVGDYRNAEVRLPSLRVADLEGLIECLLRERKPVTATQLITYFLEGGSVPANSFHLTFDDGIRDHVTNVLPVLLAYGLDGSFFIPGCLFADGGSLPLLEKQRFLQYAFSEYAEFLSQFCRNVVSRFPRYRSEEIEPSQRNLRRIGEYLAEYGFYSPEERYYRYLRDQVLQEPEFAVVVEALFAERFGSEEAVCRTHYLSPHDVGVLHRAGMTIGGHGLSHQHLPRMPDQRRDIAEGLRVITQILGTCPTTFSYPYGSYDESTLRLMNEFGMVYAFTTRNRVGLLDRGCPYNIARVDAKELVR